MKRHTGNRNTTASARAHGRKRVREVSAAITGGVAGLFLSVSAVAQDEPVRFVSAVPDLPLMDGLQEVSSAPFETAQGRIVQVEAAGRVDAADVAVFYARALPALGWRALVGEGLAFHRAGERLTVSVTAAPQDAASGAFARVTFHIEPLSAAAPGRP